MAKIALHEGSVTFGIIPVSNALVSGSLSKDQAVRNYHLVGVAAPGAVKPNANQWTAQMEVLIESTSSSVYYLLHDQLITDAASTLYVYQPDNITSGSILYQGDAKIVSVTNAMNQRAGEATPATATFNFIGNGALTKSAVV